jgi:hypothetical protein
MGKDIISAILSREQVHIPDPLAWLVYHVSYAIHSFEIMGRLFVPGKGVRIR